jgi:hypothetical protein
MGKERRSGSIGWVLVSFLLGGAGLQRGGGQAGAVGVLGGAGLQWGGGQAGAVGVLGGTGLQWHQQAVYQHIHRGK